MESEHTYQVQANLSILSSIGSSHRSTTFITEGPQWWNFALKGMPLNLPEVLLFSLTTIANKLSMISFLNMVMIILSAFIIYLYLRYTYSMSKLFKILNKTFLNQDKKDTSDMVFHNLHFCIVTQGKILREKDYNSRAEYLIFKKSCFKC